MRETTRWLLFMIVIAAAFLLTLGLVRILTSINDEARTFDIECHRHGGITVEVPGSKIACLDVDYIEDWR